MHPESRASRCGRRTPRARRSRRASPAHAAERVAAERQRASRWTSRERRAHRCDRGARRRVAPRMEDDGPRITIAAFAVAGGPLQTPGPVLRAPVGTEIRVTMHNALAVPMWVYGLGEHHGFADSALLAPGETRELHFRATTPGLSYYAGRTTAQSRAAPETRRSQLNGVIVDRSPGAVPSRSHFRHLGLGTRRFDHDERTWSQRDARPSTDSVGRTRRASTLSRAIRCTGDSSTSSELSTSAASARRLLSRRCQRAMRACGHDICAGGPAHGRDGACWPGQTMSMTWTPVHSGNWLFHCHFASHVTRERNVRLRSANADATIDLAADAARRCSIMQHMSGLVIGIRVHPRGTAGGDRCPSRSKCGCSCARARTCTVNTPATATCSAIRPRPPSATASPFPVRRSSSRAASASPSRS